ncbi:MAG: sugar phosphate isomerase/epimerase [Planctomycetota bacterium]|jgi:sugar phosphate isomerase/epimerase|nr:sugar phosphate isomerase/epimerase [Planctomycetota bacterium]
MATPQITVQLYSVREQAGADYEGTIRAIADMGFRNVEPAGFPGTTPEQAAKLFKELGLSAPSCHTGLPVGDNKNQVIETALTMGHKYLITGCPPNFREDFATADTVKKTAELYCEAAANAAEHGMQVGYHNHDWDLCAVGDTRGYKIFLDNTPDTVLWEADLFWVCRAGLDPVAFVQEIGVRGKCLHFKDGAVDQEGTFTEAETEDGKIMVSNDKPFMPAGTGQVPLKDVAKVMSHTEYVAVELDSYVGDMMQAVAESYTYLTSNGIAVGAK